MMSQGCSTPLVQQHWYNRRSTSLETIFVRQETSCPVYWYPETGLSRSLWFFRKDSAMSSTVRQTTIWSILATRVVQEIRNRKATRAVSFIEIIPCSHHRRRYIPKWRFSLYLLGRWMINIFYLLIERRRRAGSIHGYIFVRSGGRRWNSLY